MKAAAKKILYLAAVTLIASCAPSRFVKPLKKNESVATVSFGGELIKYSGAPIPIPFTTVGYGKGLSDKVTGFGNLHTTSLLFGNLQADLGATIGLLPAEKKFGLSVSPALQMAYHLQDNTSFRIWPSIDLNAYYTMKNKPSYVYGGLNGWFELSGTRAHGQPQPHQVIPNLQAGYVIVKTKWQHQIEIKYLGAGIANLPNVVEYIGIGGKGALGIYYGVIKKF